MVDLLAPELVSDSPACDDALSRAQHHLALGEYQEAVAACCRAIAVCPTERMAYLYRGSAYQLMGKTAQAAADYATAHRLAQ